MISGYCKIEDIPERYRNRKIIKIINASFKDYEKKKRKSRERTKEIEK